MSIIFATPWQSCKTTVKWNEILKLQVCSARQILENVTHSSYFAFPPRTTGLQNVGRHIACVHSTFNIISFGFLILYGRIFKKYTRIETNHNNTFMNSLNEEWHA